MNAYAQSADTYLVQRVLSAGPEQQAALLMEAGQLFLGRAIKAIQRRDHLEMGRCLGRVGEIITESMLRLNHEEGGELVQNLSNIYDWWNRELFEASNSKDTERLAALSHYMGEIRQAWEQLHEKQTRALQTHAFPAGERVV